MKKYKTTGKKKYKVFSTLVFMFLALWSYGQTDTIYQSAIIVDGDLSDWDTVEVYSSLTDKAPDYALDSKLSWDDENLYVLFEVEDDTAAVFGKGIYVDQKPWVVDLVYLHLDVDNSKNDAYDGNNDFALRIHRDTVLEIGSVDWPVWYGKIPGLDNTPGYTSDVWGTSYQSGFLGMGLSMVQNETEGGYTIEIGVPFSFLTKADDNLSPSDFVNNSKLGLRIELHDMDAIDNQSGLSIPAGSQWGDPSTWGTISLQGGSDSLPDTEPNDELSIYFVSQETGASDSNQGTKESPFLTIQKAASIADAGDTIFVREGVYRETVTPANSGTDSSPIVYMPYQGENVTISGADTIVGWEMHQGNIYKASMAGDFFTNNVNMTDQVFVDGKMMNLARWPNNGFDISHPVKAITEKYVSKTRDEANNMTTGVMVDNDLPAGDYVGAELYMQPNNGGWSWLFTGEVTKVEGTEFTFETRSNSSRLNNGGGYHDNSRYYFYNKMSLLDTVGEWYHDKQENSLYLWLPDNGIPDEHIIEAKKRVYGFNLSGKSYVTIKGFKFFACNITTDDISGGDGKGYAPDGSKKYPWRYGSLAESHNVVIDGIECLYPSHSTDMSGHFFFQYGSHSGIVLSGEDHVLKNSIIRCSFANAISLLGDRHKIHNNIITDINYNAGGYGAIGQSATLAYDCEFAYNTIRRTGRSGIRQGFRNSDPNNIVARIHHNVISDFMIQDNDGGGYYHSGDGGFLRVDHNIIYNGKGIMINGIYPDYGKNYIYDHNVLYNTWSNFWFVHSDKAEHITNFIAYNNTCVATNNDNFGDGTWGGPSNFNMFSSKGTNVIKNNIGWVYTPPEAPYYNFIRYHNSSGSNVIANNLTGQDPMFKSYPEDLSLQTGSPAIDAAEPITDTVIDGITIPAFNDPVIGQMDKGAYEFGIEPFKAGSTLEEDKKTGSVITIFAAGKTGNETIVLLERGNPVAVFPNVSGNFDAKITTTYTYTSNIPVTGEMVQVWLKTENEDEEVLVDKISIDNVELESEDMYCSCTIEKTEILNCNGFFHYRSRRNFNLTVEADNGTSIILPSLDTYPEDMQVTLIAVPDTGFQFHSWFGDIPRTRTDTIVIFMNENKTISALFTEVTGIEAAKLNNEFFQVYPNPVSGEKTITISADGFTGDLMVVGVLDVYGRKLFHAVQEGLLCQIKLPSDLTPGTYILTIKSGKEIAAKRLILLGD